ncbi:MAG: tetratricopeptide repeat protein [bacterium]
MIAQGQSIPAHDAMIQWPEGIDPSRTLCLGLERASGTAYRWLSPLLARPPFHVWCAYFPQAVSSLGVVAAYVAGAAVWGGAAPGLLAAALYAFSLATVARSIGAFGHEDFALPFFFLATALLLRVAAGRGGARSGAAATLLLAVAIGSWHFSRFAHGLLTAALVLGVLVTPSSDRRRVLVALAWCGAARLVAAIVFPVVRETWLASLRGAHGVDGGAGESAYGHVRALLLDKIRFFGRKPANPGLLSPDARSLWIEDFASPSLYLVIMLFAVPALLGIAALRLARRRAASGALIVLGILLVLSGASFLLVKRLFVLTAFFLSAWAGGAALAARDPRGRRLRPALVTALVLGLAVEALKVAYHGEDSAPSRVLRGLFPASTELTIPNWQASDSGLVDWIRRHTNPADAFVARASTSAMILAYAERPVVLHPKFEVPGVRRRCRDFDAALYGTEESLWKFCRDHGARFFVYEARLSLENGPDSERYVGCATRLAKTSAAYRLHFAPTGSPRFRPLYRNPSYAVFEVVDVAASATVDSAAEARPSATSTTPGRASVALASPGPASWPDGGGPLYEIAQFGGQPLDGDFFDDSFTLGVVENMEKAIALFSAAQAQIASRRADLARLNLERAQTFDPALPGLQTSLGLAIALGGDFAKALPLCRREVDVAPDLALAWRNLGWVEANLGRLDEARAHLGRALELDPADVGARRMLDQVNATPPPRS